MATDPDKIRTYAMTPDQFQAFRILATQNGVTLSGWNQGTATDPVYDLVMNYDFDGAVLTLTLVSDAWWLPDSAVWGELSKFLPA
jgi:hypothetical protein